MFSSTIYRCKVFLVYWIILTAIVKNYKRGNLLLTIFLFYRLVFLLIIYVLKRWFISLRFILKSFGDELYAQELHLKHLRVHYIYYAVNYYFLLYFHSFSFKSLWILIIRIRVNDLFFLKREINNWHRSRSSTNNNTPFDMNRICIPFLYQGNHSISRSMPLPIWPWE